MKNSLENKYTKRKATGSHFTPPELASVVTRRILREIEIGDARDAMTVLDPACGDGELLLAFDTQTKNLNLSLVGIEQDPVSLAGAENRLQDCKHSTNFIHGDFLEMAGNSKQVSLPLFDDAPQLDNLALVDIIIANPPYVRTQVLGAEKAQQLAANFGLSGRVDLYHAFLVAMTAKLKPGGILGVITSNRYLTTRGGAAIREFLNCNYDIIEILDLGDTKLFEAAVLPAIFIGRKKNLVGRPHDGDVNGSRFLRIYEGKNHPELQIPVVQSVYDLLDSETSGTYQSLNESKVYTVSTGNLEISTDHTQPWVLATSNESLWINQIDSRSMCRIEEIANVRVGIKTTADTVFIRSDWDGLDEELRPETELLRPLFSAEYASRWRPTESKPTRRVLYTHHVTSGKRRPIELDKFPKAERYLEQHRARLEGREYVRKAGRMWYEIWVPQNPSQWKLPKVVFPDISPEPKFFFDTEGCIVDGNCYWIAPKDDTDTDILFLIMAVANSHLMTKYHDIAFQNKLYAGRRRYLTQYINKYPIPDPSSDNAVRLISLAKRLVFENMLPEAKEEIEREIELHTALAFGVHND